MFAPPRRCQPVAAVIVLSLAAVLGGCASGPSRTGGSSGAPGTSPDRDGPEANPPPDLVRVPDAEPQLEVIRSGGPNKPYEVLGRSYVPQTQDRSFSERGLASWYGKKFHGRRTASGEVYNMYSMTAAHPTLPIPSYARVRNPANGREVVVRINDRGPFHPGRIVDLSYTAALKLDVLRGVTPVELERITYEDIRTGAWRRGAGDAPVQVAVVTPTPTPTPLPRAPAVTSPSPEPSAPTGLRPSGTSVSTTLIEPVVAVDLPPVADAPAARAFTQPARGYWVQLGAFRQRDGAEGFHQRVVAEVTWIAPLLAVFNDSALFRLQAGPYTSRDEAAAAAERVREALQLVPVIVERR